MGRTCRARFSTCLAASDVLAPVDGISIGAVHRYRLAIACLVLVLTISSGDSIAWSATYTWSSTATGTSWNVASNWGGTVPQSGDIGLFSAGSYTSQPSLSSPASVGGIWDTGSGAITIGGTTLTLYGASINGNAGTDVELDPGAGPFSINAPVTLEPNLNDSHWINNSASPLTINGSLRMDSIAFVLSGSGLVSLNGLTTGQFSNLVVNGGTCSLAQAASSRVRRRHRNRWRHGKRLFRAIGRFEHLFGRDHSWQFGWGVWDVRPQRRLSNCSR